jgi:5-formyltetrahydrofolate cyclo-ligase
MSLFEPAISDSKAEIRHRILALRDALPADKRAAAAEAIARRGLPVPIPAESIVSGFMPIRSEINPLPLMRRCADMAAQLALPAIAGRGLPLIMRAWRVGDPLVSGQWKIREPSGDAVEVIPDILLVPLVAFDRRGNRLGYGAGYYDRTIAAVRACKPVTAIGIAFAAQQIDTVPITDSDQPLDFVVTEAETIDCAQA